jgi:hypothetical protein
MANKAKRLSGINTLAYLGIEPITAPLLLVEQRIPTTDDRVGNQIGALWILEQTDTVPARIFLLVRLQGSGPSGIATWVELTTGGGGGGVQQFNTDNGIVLPAAGIVNELGGTSVGGVATNINTFANPNLSNNLFVALNNSIFFPDTTGIASGVIGFGGSAAANRFIHNFGTGGGADSNTFVGLSAGNFTLTGTNSVGVGANALFSLTSGSGNTALGVNAGLSLDAGNSNTIVGLLAGSSLTTGSFNVIVGVNAGLSMTTANNNTFVGHFAGFNATSSDNVAVGENALAGTTSSGPHVAVGLSALASVTNAVTNHVAIGYQSLTALTTALRCTAVGHQSANAVTTTANDLTAVGWHAGFNATTVTSSTFIGSNAGALSSGTDNVFVGLGVGQSGCSGAQNTGVGTEALEDITSGSDNTAVGYQALNQLNTGSDNTVIGNLAGSSITSGSDNVAIGDQSLLSATTISNNISIGSDSLSILVNQSSRNIAIGSLAAQNYTGSSTGESSLAIGYNAMNAATSQVRMMAIGDSAMSTGQGDNTMAIGFEAGQNMGFSTSSVLIGYQAGRNLNTGSVVNGGIRTVAIGTQAIGVGTLTGEHNVMIGFQAGENLEAAENSVAIGAFSMDEATDASDCIALGTSSLGSILTGTNCIAIGSGAGIGYVGAESSNIVIGNAGTVGDNNTIRIGTQGAGAGQQNLCFVAGILGTAGMGGNAVTVLAGGQLADGTVSSLKYKKDICDMDKDSENIMQLRPVTFSWKDNVNNSRHFGLIAEEVREVMQSLSSYDHDGNLIGVHYDRLPVLLLNELQKLEKRVSHLERLYDTCKHIC